jgi:ribosomal protein S11
MIKSTKLYYKIFFVFTKNNGFINIIEGNSKNTVLKTSIGLNNYTTKRLKLNYYTYFTIGLNILKLFKLKFIGANKRTNLFIYIKGNRSYKKKIVNKLLQKSYLLRYIKLMVDKKSFSHNGCRQKKKRRIKRKNFVRS